MQLYEVTALRTNGYEIHVLTSAPTPERAFRDVVHMLHGIELEPDIKVYEVYSFSTVQHVEIFQA